MCLKYSRKWTCETCSELLLTELLTVGGYYTINKTHGVSRLIYTILLHPWQSHDSHTEKMSRYSDIQYLTYLGTDGLQTRSMRLRSCLFPLSPLW